MEKIKEYKGIIIIVLVILGIAFYWFQLRPVSIKKNCSWVTEKIPADPGVTKEQADVNKKIYDQCISSNWQCNNPKLGRFLLEWETHERLPKIEKEETRGATDKEYNQCLRQNGL